MELQTIAPTEISPVHETTDVPKRLPMHAVAVNATEMAEANEHIREFLVAKIGSLETERDGLSEAARVAEENGWKNDQLTRSEAAASGRRRLHGCSEYALRSIRDSREAQRTLGRA